MSDKLKIYRNGAFEEIDWKDVPPEGIPDEPHPSPFVNKEDKIVQLLEEIKEELIKLNAK